MSISNKCNNLKKWWIKKKNSQISNIAISFINSRIKDYGKVSNLSIDSVKKNIILKLILKGEKQRITVRIEKYEIISSNGVAFIRLNNISISKAWIDSLIKNIIIPNYVPDSMIEINKNYARIVELLI